MSSVHPGCRCADFLFICPPLQALYLPLGAAHQASPAWLQAHQFLGEQDSTQQPQHFVVETSAAHSQLPHSIPRLPSGNLVSGLPAAVASHCQVVAVTCAAHKAAFCEDGALKLFCWPVLDWQVHGVPATLLLSVDATPFPDSIAMCALANALASLLRHTGAALPPEASVPVTYLDIYGDVGVVLTDVRVFGCLQGLAT
jgi:hypothetical protein